MGSYTSRVNAYKPADDGSDPPSVTTDINHNADVIENGLGAVPTVALPSSAFSGKIVLVDGKVYAANGAMPGGTWLELAQTLSAIKTSNEQVTATTTPQADDALALTLPAGYYYELSSNVVYGTLETVDFKFGLTVPANGWAEWGAIYKGASAATGNTGTPAHDSLATAAEPQAGGWTADNTSKMRVKMNGLVYSGDGGVFAIRWSQVTSSATATIVYQRSYLTLRKI